MAKKKNNLKNVSISNEGSSHTKSKGSSIQTRLQSLSKTELLDLIDFLFNKNKNTTILVSEWFQHLLGSAQDNKQSLIDEELILEYWEKAEEIISEFNEYGGGPEEKEEEAYEWLEKISDLIKKGSLSSQAKLDFIDEAFFEYDKENSGFEDGLMDLFFEICSTREEWMFLIEKLQKKHSDWRDHLIMEILKAHLYDDENYVKLRKKHLHYGMDYWDLVTFYLDKKDLIQAVSIAEQGLTKGAGRIDEIVKFLTKHYRQQNDAANLKRIHQIVKLKEMNRNTPRKKVPTTK